MFELVVEPADEGRRDFGWKQVRLDIREDRLCLPLVLLTSCPSGGGAESVLSFSFAPFLWSLPGSEGASVFR